MAIIIRAKQGGTGSDTTLTNDKVIVSSGDKLVETTTTTTQVNLLDTINSIETGSADNDKLVTQGYGDDNWAGGGHLDQQQAYYVGKAGSDSHDGKSVESPFLTIGKAITEVNGQTPGSGNQFVIKTIGAAVWNETGLAIPTYTLLDISDGVFSGTIVSMATNSRFWFGEIRPVVAPTNTITVTGSGTRWIKGQYTTPSSGSTLIFTGTGAFIHLDVDVLNMQATAAKVYSANSGSVIYLTANKFRETAASYNDGSATVFETIPDSGANADRRLINQIGDVYVTSNSGDIIFRSVNEVLRLTGSFPKWTRGPLFLVHNINDLNLVTGDSTLYQIPYDVVDNDFGSDYSTGTHDFTAPVNGLYYFSISAHLTGITAAHKTCGIALFIDSLATYFMDVNIANLRTGSNDARLSATLMVVPVAAAQTVSVKIQVGGAGATKVINIKKDATFSGGLLSVT